MDKTVRQLVKRRDYHAVVIYNRMGKQKFLGGGEGDDADRHERPFESTALFYLPRGCD
jgi:hypothetical protein